MRHGPVRISEEPHIQRLPTGPPTTHGGGVGVISGGQARRLTAAGPTPPRVPPEGIAWQRPGRSRPCGSTPPHLGRGRVKHLGVTVLQLSTIVERTACSGSHTLRPPKSAGGAAERINAYVNM
jgi:hypothetical protein